MPTDQHQRRHVYLFRHCVRSTSDDVRGVDPNTPGIKGMLTDYIGPDHQLPEWHATESMDCSKRGLKIMEGEGQHVARELLEEMQDETIYAKPKKRIRLRFISDITKRDSDTTLALIRGFNGVFTRESIDVSVQYDQDLYRPLSDRRLSFGLNKLMDDNFTPLCEKKYTDVMLRSELEDRLHNLPRPEGSLLQVLQVMQKVTGSDAWYQKDNLDKITISDDGEVQGAINPLRVITQAVFYARASKIEPTFLPDITTELLYRLLEWTYWYVALTEQENSHALSTVAPLAALIIQIFKNAKTEDIDDDVLTAYIFVGHDTDIARLSSAFGLRHNLEAPYFTSARARALYSPAPPGSAMHLVHDVGNQIVETEFIYPTLITADDKLVWDGRLDSVPMKKRNPEAIGDNKKQLAVQRLSHFGGPNTDECGIDILERRTKKNLGAFDGAMECYDRAKFLTTWPKPSIRDAYNTNSDGELLKQELFGLRIGSDGGVNHKQLLYALAATVGIIFLSVLARKTTPAEKANVKKRPRPSPPRPSVSPSSSPRRATAARQRILSGESSLGDDYANEFEHLNVSHTE